ncbi:IpaC/SipC family type III secretion system effector [Iodobacter ciconiae]|uniref:Effector protein BipC n=1 Tax=Iodobacter ciconiae TaxID=2496266 RepID=A0A3S8ZQZ7_9NEIS|nr:IpaC/SipC family type III secretion system effector [Iodobacter ciconiae]AZN35903.1 hypothetical protein EJO50_05045 [Iodobacter ciconiae]
MVAINSHYISTLANSKAYTGEVFTGAKVKAKPEGSVADVLPVKQGQLQAGSVGKPDLSLPVLSELPPLTTILGVLAQTLDDSEGQLSLGGSIAVLEKKSDQLQKEDETESSFDISGLGSKWSGLYQALLRAVQDNRTAEAKLGGKMSKIEERSAIKAAEATIAEGNAGMASAVGQGVVSLGMTGSGVFRKSQGLRIEKNALKFNGGQIRKLDSEADSMLSQLKTGSRSVMDAPETLKNLKVSKPVASENAALAEAAGAPKHPVEIAEFDVPDTASNKKSKSADDVSSKKNGAVALKDKQIDDSGEAHFELADSSKQLKAEDRAVLEEQAVNKVKKERDLHRAEMQQNMLKAEGIKAQGDAILGLNMGMSGIIRGSGEVVQALDRSRGQLSQHAQKVGASLNEESTTRKRELNSLFQDLLKQLTDVDARTASTIDAMLGNKV